MRQQPESSKQIVSAIAPPGLLEAGRRIQQQRHNEMKDYLVTVEIRMRVPAINESIAKQNAIVGCFDPVSVERLGVEWLGQDVVCCDEAE